MRNILITCAGRRVSLLKSFETEVQNLGLDSQVYAADMTPDLSSACQVARKFFKISSVINEFYIEELISIVKENNIGILIPTIDTELEILANNRNLFSENNCSIILSDIEFIKNCNDKRKTQKLFYNLNFDTPKVFTPDRLIYPLFIKPFDGSRTIDTHIVLSEDEINKEYLSNPKYIFQEYINQENYYEITVDVYYDRHSILKCIIPRKRLEVRDGEVSKGLTIMPIYFDKLLDNLSKVKGAKGCINVQFLVKAGSEDRILGIEINPRFGGGFPLSYAAGGNFPKWILMEYMLNMEVDYFGKWQQNMLMLRYDEAVFINDYKG